MIETSLYLDDGNVLPTLRALICEPSAIADAPGFRTLRCEALGRLNYPTLQAMLALKIAFDDRIGFVGLEHLEPALIRYGFKASFFVAKQSDT